MTSEELRNVTFERVMRGYRTDDVDELLQKTALSLDEAIAARKKAEADVEEARQRMLVLADRIEQYRADEDNIKMTMLNAQRTGESILREARQRAQELLNEAEEQAADMVNAAKAQAEEIVRASSEGIAAQEKELERAKCEVALFKNKMLSAYREHIQLLTMLPEPEVEAEAKEEESAEAVSAEMPVEEAAEAAVEEAETVAEQPAAEEEVPATVAEETVPFTMPAIPSFDFEAEAGQPDFNALAQEFNVDSSANEEAAAEDNNGEAGSFDSFTGIKFD